MSSPKEEGTCSRCGRSEREVTISQHFAAGDGCGIEAYFLCVDCEREEDEGQDE